MLGGVQELDRRCAVKRLEKHEMSEQDLEEFSLEATILAALQPHQHVVEFFGFFEDEVSYSIVTREVRAHHRVRVASRRKAWV